MLHENHLKTDFIPRIGSWNKIPGSTHLLNNNIKKLSQLTSFDYLLSTSQVLLDFENQIKTKTKQERRCYQP